MFYKTILTIAYLPFKLLFPFKATGIENLPEGRVVVAGNHSSNADSVMVLMSMPWDGKTRIIGKKELFKLKIMNWFLRKMGAFPVDRGEADIDAVKECLSTLKNDGRLLIFPEGTRVKEDAVAAKPPIIMADEPTGNLDSKAGADIMGKLIKLNDEGATIILITHDNKLAKVAKRVITIKDAHKIGDEITDEALRQAAIAEVLKV